MRKLVKDYRVKNLDLASQGKESIYLAEMRMPTLLRIRKRFEEEKPLDDVRIGACLHVTRETAVLLRTLRAGGASVALCGSNPLSTQDDVAAALVEEGFNVYAWRGNDDEYYACIQSVLQLNPAILIDDGADLIVTAHREWENLLKKGFGAQEETTTGVTRLRIMDKEDALKTPVIAVNDAKIKMMFDNRYGTGQGVVSVIKAMNVLFAGKVVVVAGYGWCSKGLAMRARGLGAEVIVTEVDPFKALEAVMDGYRVLPMSQAIEEADMIFTSTGCRDVVAAEHFRKMKDGTILANLGHFNVEVAVDALEQMAEKKRRVREDVDEYTLPNGNRLYLIAEGRLANLVTLGGHPSEIMDLSFSVQALTAEYLTKNHGTLENKVYEVSEAISQDVARVKLETMNIQIDSLTRQQLNYVRSFKVGT
ncbi:MAG: adenosylhomocysteinase [Candidatus Bathyarchaeota archaeon]|nr:adenosylhomocysteinase [Candidatus Bathyarchaeota archaeon]